MEENDYQYHVSHIVRCKNGNVKRKNGEKVENFFLQVILSKGGEKRTVCWIENGKKKFFNCKNEEETRTAIKRVLDKYYKFDFEILTLDKAYEEGLSIEIVSSFISGRDNIQERINLYKLKKDLN